MQNKENWIQYPNSDEYYYSKIWLCGDNDLAELEILENSIKIYCLSGLGRSCFEVHIYDFNNFKTCEGEIMNPFLVADRICQKFCELSIK